MMTWPGVVTVTQDFSVPGSSVITSENKGDVIHNYNNAVIFCFGSSFEYWRKTWTFAPRDGGQSSTGIYWYPSLSEPNQSGFFQLPAGFLWFLADQLADELFCYFIWKNTVCYIKKSVWSTRVGIIMRFLLICQIFIWSFTNITFLHTLWTVNIYKKVFILVQTVVYFLASQCLMLQLNHWYRK